MMEQRDTLLNSAEPNLPVEQLRGWYVAMLRIRLFEERVATLVEERELRTPCHLYIGQEAVAVGVCAALRQDDYAFGTHRSHGHYLAKGGDMKAMMAELFGKKTGCSGGRGGSMHLIAPEVGLLGTVPIVSGTIPLAVGAALAAKLQGTDRVSVAFFGDGALEEGTAHESLNIAAHRKLPVIFVCENNLYASHLHLSERRARDNIPELAIAYGMPGLRVDGNNVVQVYRVATDLVRRARAGQGPALLECRTYRWRGHVGPNWDLDVGITRKQELGEWMRNDPIARLRDWLVQEGVLPQEFDRIAQEVAAEVEEAVSFARASPYPDPAELLDHVFYENGGQPYDSAQA